MANQFPAFPSGQDNLGGIPGDVTVNAAVDALENLIGPDAAPANVVAQTIPDIIATSSLTTFKWVARGFAELVFGPV